MIDIKDFTAMRKAYDKDEKIREMCISRSRDIIKLSKQIIYAMHRGDHANAKNLMKRITADVKKLQGFDSSHGIMKVALQEYVEALTYYHFVTEGNLIPLKKTGVDYESYLLGICDLTGELVRKAVNDIINGNQGSAYLIKELISSIYEQFLKFDLRNSELRKKSDSIKWNLTKVEDIIYNIETRD